MQHCKTSEMYHLYELSFLSLNNIQQFQRFHLTLLKTVNISVQLCLQPSRPPSECLPGYLLHYEEVKTNQKETVTARNRYQRRSLAIGPPESHGSEAAPSEPRPESLGSLKHLNLPMMCL